MTIYRAEVTRDGKFWAIRVPQVGRSTQARRLPEVEDMARELVCLMEDLQPEQVEIEVEVQLPETVRGHLASAHALRADADRQRAEATRASQEAVKELSQMGLSTRDIGMAIGVSHQRVAQLMK